MRSLAAAALLLLASSVRADDAADLKKLLATPILNPRQTLLEVREYLDAKVPRLPEATTAEAWEKETARLQKEVLEKVVFRGEAAKWKDAKCEVVYSEGFAGEGYTVKKLRFEIIPGFWVPALLYVPEKLEGKAPVVLAVNGHDRAGKAADYKQIRCINLAKRGVIVLNVEWLGMGQLNVPGNPHGAMDQLNLCGTSGLSLFYLNMTRGLDLLLAHPNADPKRVAVSGLSGGGWQTITISGLDPRVTLSNPVAGYSSFRTRIQHFKDLGDSEQTPCDLATLVDYTHLTAMRAPRPTLLTFNAKDNCCFESGYALPPLERGSLPFFKLFGKEANLRTHVNHVPGDHNFGQENREALYKMIGDHFFPESKNWSSKEIECKSELKTPAQLNVELPKDSLTINATALRLAEKLPRRLAVPAEKDKLDEWANRRRKEVAAIVRLPKEQPVEATRVKDRNAWTLKVGGMTVPVLEFLPAPESKGTTIVIADGGRAAAAERILQFQKEGRHVLVADLYYFGEMHPPSHDWLWTLMLATVGDRALGIQAAQLNAIAKWAKGDVKVVAIGPRTSTIATIAAAIDAKAIGTLELHEPLGSFKEILETNRVVATTPELFCFGLLEHFDTADLAALVAPRPVSVKKPSDRVTKDWAGLAARYKAMGKDFDPFQ
jgi:dienelactone hydrolase